MNIGITFGGYVPLHQGHLDLIMQAKKENDMAFVVVCGYEEEPRTKQLGIDFFTRTKIIKDYLEDDVLKVVGIYDNDLGIDESMSDFNWGIWSSAIFEKIFSKEYNIDRNNEINFTFYVAEERYVRPLEEVVKNVASPHNLKVVLIDRSNNNVSGTLCRANPIKYWNKIAKPFRGYLTHKILIAGTASEGKTILINDIAKYYSLVYSYEKGRDNCKIKKDDKFDGKDFIYNIYEQNKYNNSLIFSGENNGVFISDTDNIVTLMYAYMYSKRENFALTQQEYSLIYELVKTYRDSNNWNKIFLLAPHEKPIVDDGERYMGDSDYEIRKEYFEILKSFYDEFGYQYEILTGNYYENFLRVKQYIGGLYEKN